MSAHTPSFRLLSGRPGVGARPGRRPLTELGAEPSFVGEARETANSGTIACPLTTLGRRSSRRCRRLLLPATHLAQGRRIDPDPPKGIHEIGEDPAAAAGAQRSLIRRSLPGRLHRTARRTNCRRPSGQTGIDHSPLSIAGEPGLTARAPACRHRQHICDRDAITAIATMWREHERESPAPIGLRVAGSFS
jgi:hypothetical protein